MSLELVLTEIRRLLENGKTGTASDVLCEFLLDNFGELTAVNLPANIADLPPNIIVSRLRIALMQLLQDAHDATIPDNQVNSKPDDVDLSLILQTSNEYEARQKEYIPGEENQDISRSSLLKTTLPVEPPSKKLSITEEKGISHDHIVSEIISPDIPTASDLPENLPDDVDDATLVFAEFDDETGFDLYADCESLLEDELYCDEEDDRADLIEIDYDGKISRLERAGQIAYQLGAQFDWNDQEIALLQEVFYERGWQQARVAMEYLLNDGMTYEQLLFAKKLKKLWDLRSDLTIAFHYSSKIKTEYCYPGEQILSWRVAIEIVKNFDGCNDFEEVEQFVEEAFDSWYSSVRLRHDYKSFLQYLRSTVDCRDCLSPNLMDFEYVETYLDTNDYLYEVLSEQLHKDGARFNLQPNIW